MILEIHLSKCELREIAAIARIECEKVGRAAPVSTVEMARALLQAHLILIRDCGDILPDLPELDAAGKIEGKGGVSLSGGSHGRA